MRCRSVISSQHGGCVIIPRDHGYIRLVVTEPAPTIFKAHSKRRLYTQLDISRAGEIAKSRQANTADAAESGGQLDISTITAEEVLEQANRIFAPYKLKFAAPLSWFAVWKSKF